MQLDEAKRILKNAGYLLESAGVRNIDDFVEQLSNCCGHVIGNEIVFRKHYSDYIVSLRNSGKTFAKIEYEYPEDKITVKIHAMSPSFDESEEYSRDELTVDKIKEIGKKIRKAAEYMANNHL